MTSVHPPRMLGVFARDPEVARRAVRWASSRGSAAQVIERTTAAGTLGVVLHGSPRRPNGWTEDGDSFAAVDGEFYTAAGPSSDPAPVLDAYLRGGLPALAALDGTAAVALWDARRQELLLFRDRDGLEPLFLVAAPDALYWATDLPSLIPFLDDREIDRTALDFLLAEGYIPSPMTIVHGISRLAAGELLVATTPARHRLQTYARLSGRPKVQLDKAARTNRFAELFEGSLRRRTSSDQSPGVLVSGGVDSTLILAMLARVVGVSPRAYTFRYEDYSGWKNEGREARRAASSLGVPHEEVSISPADIRERAPELVRQYGEPFTYGLHSYQLGPIAASGVEVLFSGQGRDYLMSSAQRVQAGYGALPAAVRQALDILPALAAPVPAVARRLSAMFDAAPSWGARIYAEGRTPAAIRASLYAGDHLEGYRRSSIDLLDEVSALFEGEAPLERLLLPIQRLMDSDFYVQWNYRWGDAHDLAVRQPFRDRRMLNFLFTLKGIELDKQEQRRYAATLLPHDLAFAPKTHQALPLQEWLREGGALLPYAREQLSDERVRASGLFTPDGVRRLLDNHAAGRINQEWTIWGLITTLLWQEHVLAAAPTIEA